MTGLIILVIAALCGAGGLLARSRYERRHFVTEKYVIHSEKIIKRELNYVFLSDLHNNEFGRDNGELIAEIDRIRPDGVLIGGDMMVCKGTIDLSVVSCLLEELSSRYPIFYGNGNHEQRMAASLEYRKAYEEFHCLLKKTGVTYLSDESILTDQGVIVTGCNLEEAYYRHRFTVPELSEQDIKRHVGKGDPSRFQILLLHSPLFFDAAREWGADLTLSGHFHGGTIRLPFLGGVMTPQYQFFLPWCAGRFDKEKKTLIVSPGMGTHSVNIRLNNRPGLIWIQLKRS